MRAPKDPKKTIGLWVYFKQRSYKIINVTGGSAVIDTSTDKGERARLPLYVETSWYSLEPYGSGWDNIEFEGDLRFSRFTQSYYRNPPDEKKPMFEVWPFSCDGGVYWARYDPKTGTVTDGFGVDPANLPTNNNPPDDELASILAKKPVFKKVPTLRESGVAHFREMVSRGESIISHGQRCAVHEFAGMPGAFYLKPIKPNDNERTEKMATYPDETPEKLNPILKAMLEKNKTLGENEVAVVEAFAGYGKGPYGLKLGEPELMLWFFETHLKDPEFVAAAQKCLARREKEDKE